MEFGVFSICFLMRASFSFYCSLFLAAKPLCAYISERSFPMLFSVHFFLQISVAHLEGIDDIYISPDCIQHEFFIHFFRDSVIKPLEIFIFLDVSK